jgi:hypothetical protein
MSLLFFQNLINMKQTKKYLNRRMKVERDALYTLLTLTALITWLPLMLPSGKGAFRAAAAGIAVCAGIILVSGLGGPAEAAVFAGYCSVLAVFSRSACLFWKSWGRGVYAEALQAAVLAGMFGGLLLNLPAGFFRRFILVVNVPLVTGGIFNRNILRSCMYGISPMSGYFIRVPSWHSSALVFGVCGAVLFGAVLIAERKEADDAG